MRNTWLGNGNKAFPWDLSNLYKKPAEQKSNPMDSKYSVKWRGMAILSGNEAQSKSPVSKKRNSSITQRTLEPQFQEEIKVKTHKIPSKLPKTNISSATSREKIVENRKNTSSPSNPLLTDSIKNLYSRSSILTPEKSERPSIKKLSKQAEIGLRGNLDGDFNKPPPHKSAAGMNVKIDFISQISGLSGSVREESPSTYIGNIEKYRARGLLPSLGSETERPVRNRSNGKEQWRSSCDFIKHVVTTKSYY